MKSMICPGIRVVWLPLALAALVAVPSRAATIVLASNYDGVHNDGCADYAVGNFNGHIFAEGAKFTVADYGRFGLQRMVLRVCNYVNSANPDNYRLSIVRDNNGHPDEGEVVWAGLPQGVGPIVGNYSFTLSGTVQGGQDYWVLFEPTATDAGKYWWAFSTSPLLSCGQGGTRDSGVLASRWSTNGPPSMPWFIWPYNEIRPAFLIEGNPLPEAIILVSPLSVHLSLTNSVVIAPNNWGATVVLNGSASFSYYPRTQPLEFAWLDGTSLLATTAITTNRLGIGAHQISLVVSVDSDSGTKTVALHILAPGDAVRILISLVEQAELEGTNKRPLIAILAGAARCFDRDHIRQGENRLRSFQNKVQARITRVDDYTAEGLNAVAQEIIDAVTGHPDLPSPVPRPGTDEFPSR